MPYKMKMKRSTNILALNDRKMRTYQTDEQNVNFVKETVLYNKFIIMIYIMYLTIK